MTKKELHTGKDRGQGLVRRLSGVLTMIILAGPIVSANAAPTQDWLAAPAMTSVRLSPSGRHAAYLSPRNGGVAIVVKRLTERPWAERAVFQLDSRPVAVSWATEERLIVQSTDRAGSNMVHAVNRDGSDSVLLARSASVYHQGPRVLHLLSHNPGQILLTDDKSTAWVPDVYRVDLFTSARFQVADNPGQVYAWQADLTGEVRLAMTWKIDNRGLSYGINYRSSPRERWTESLSYSLGEPGMVSLGFMPDNETLVVASDVGFDKTRIRLFVPSTGQFGGTLHADPEVDVGSVNWSAVSGAPAFIHYEGARPHNQALDETWAGQLQQIARRVGQQAFRVVQVAAGGDRVLVLAYSATHPGTYYLFEPAKQRLRAIGDRMPGIRAGAAADTHDIEYSTRDGLKISGYLTSPRQGRSHPLVVLVHGGPWSRDVWGFDPLVQYLVDSGFAVLQANFRGSRGFGREHLFAGQREWGRKMQLDLEDAVAWAEASGYAITGRSCIMGSSYGGYAALIGATADNSSFSCAVSWVGVTDLAGQIESYRAHGNLRGHHEWAEMVGSPSDQAYLNDISPLHLVDQIRAPILLGHGMMDTQVDSSQASKFYAAARAAGKPVTLLTFADVGHDLFNDHDRRLFYHAAVQFLGKHLGEREPELNR